MSITARLLEVFNNNSLLSNRKLKSYLFWHTVNHFFQTTKNTVEKGGIIDEIDCVAESAKAMPFALGAIFLREQPKIMSSKHLVETMTESLKEVYKEKFINLYWLDHETRMLLIKKIDATSPLIGT